MLEKLTSFKKLCFAYLREPQAKKNIEIALQVIINSKFSTVLIPIASIKNREASITTTTQQVSYYTPKKYLCVTTKVTIIDSVTQDNIEFAKHWEDLENNIELATDTINYFAKLDKYNFYSIFIHYVETKFNLYNQPRYIAYRIKLLLLNQVIDKLYAYENLTNTDKVQQMQDVLSYTEYKIVKILLNSIKLHKSIEKQYLTTEELAKINRFTKYTQANLLHNNSTINVQYTKDINRNFTTSITFKHNQEHHCYLAASASETIQSRRQLISEFIQKYQFKEEKIIENAILLEATQSGTAAIHLVLKNYLQSQLNLPEDSYIIKYHTPQLNLDVTVNNKNIVIGHSLIWSDGVTIEKLCGSCIKTIGKLPAITVEGDLYFNASYPENSFYDNFKISV
jgi:hypothetical protein